LVTSKKIWANITIPAYCWYDNNEAMYKDTYGALYNWYAAREPICPTGWRLPSYVDWTILENYLGGTNLAGGKLKETGTVHWISPNTGATNETGFTGLPAGDRVEGGTFSSIGSYGNWWSFFVPSNLFIGTLPWAQVLKYDVSNLYSTGSKFNAKFGLSVRCMKNSQP
jgi:uncharacterized protein (TIGR02145 family)